MKMTLGVKILTTLSVALLAGACGGEILNPLPTCENGYKLVGDVCELDCPFSFVNVDEQCVCPEGTEQVGGSCVAVCPEGWERIDGACTLICEAGFEPVDGECLPVCEPPLVRVDTACVGPGSITGRVCDYERGIWLEGVTVSVTLGDGTVVSAVSDQEGRFTLADVPAGVYYVNFSGPNGYTNVLPAQVTEEGVVVLGPDECIPPPGHLRGRVCDERWGTWIGGATATLNDAASSTTTTDQFGSFMFFSIPPGDYIITIADDAGFTASRSATVYSGETTDIGPEVCMGAPGSVTGRICGTDGFWLTNASVSTVDGEGNLIETTTDGNGYYTLSGLQPGTYTVSVVKGSYSFSFEVEVLPDQPTTIPEPICLPPTTSMAVVTGIYDSVESVLTDIGYTVRANYTDSTTPAIVDASGTVDVINGESSFWLDSFLTDPVWMANYDIIFFNCGMTDDGLMTIATTDQALENLRGFAEAGGSIYASDWASEVIRLAFPGRVLYDGDDTAFGVARVGVADDTLNATVVDGGLAASLGSTSVVINLNLAIWVVMEPVQNQPSDVRVLLKADVKKYNDPFGITQATVLNAPLTLRFDFGAGRVLYTSAHNEANMTPDLEHVLNYIIFEL